MSEYTTSKCWTYIIFQYHDVRYPTCIHWNSYISQYIDIGYTKSVEIVYVLCLEVGRYFIFLHQNDGNPTSSMFQRCIYYIFQHLVKIVDIQMLELQHLDMLHILYHTSFSNVFQHFPTFSNIFHHLPTFSNISDEGIFPCEVHFNEQSQAAKNLFGNYSKSILQLQPG